MKDGPILFTVDNCPLCPKVASEIAPYLEGLGYGLLIRKPKVPELKMLPGFPALYIPKGIEGSDQDLVLVGADILVYLKKVFEKDKD